MAKKVLLLLIFICAIFLGKAQTQFSYSKFINGYWGNWEQSQLIQTNGNKSILMYDYVISGDLSELIIYEKNNHPSKHIVKISSIEMKQFINDKDFKKHVKDVIKQKKPLKFNGTIEYSDWWSDFDSKGGTTKDFDVFIDKFPTSFPVNRKRNEKVIINVFFGKKNEKILNVYFENDTKYGLALGFN